MNLKKVHDKEWEQARKEVTDTHKRCSVCREWKYHHYFYAKPKGLAGISKRCKDCDHKYNALFVANMSQEAYMKMKQRQYKREREKRRENRVFLRKDATRIVNWLLDHGWTKSGLSKELDLSRLSIRKAADGTNTYVKTETYEKYRTLYMKVLDTQFKRAYDTGISSNSSA